MLDELMDFEEIPRKAPRLNIKKPSLKKVSTNPRSREILLEISKDEISEQPPQPQIDIILNENGELTLGQKVLLRKREENEKKKRAEIYKELHKKKKMNLNQFLSRMQKYEQKKKYNLEQKKYQQLQKETEPVQEKPKLSYNTVKICKTMPKEPLYKRTNEVLEEHEQELKNLTTFYSLPREVRERYSNENNNTKSNQLNKSTKSNKFNRSKKFKTKSYSVENTRYNNLEELNKSLQTYENINEKKNKQKKKMTKQKSDQFFENQEKWLKNKKVNNQYFEKFYQIQNDKYSDLTFRPFISQATLEILDIKNRLNTNNDEFYKYKIPNTYSQYNNFILNKGRTIWDKLYEEAFQEKHCIESQTLYNNIRKKNRFRNISSKYFDLYTKNGNKVKNKRKLNNSTDIKQNKLKIKSKMINKSFDDKNRKNNFNLNNTNGMSATPINIEKKKENKRRSFFECSDANEYNFYKMKKEKEKYHWRNSLLNIKPLFTEPYDLTYHLNIMNSGAWNNNYVNKITFDNNTKCRSVINLVNLD